jgi:Ca2+-binding EF-hand superfamily protein
MSALGTPLSAEELGHIILREADATTIDWMQLHRILRERISDYRPDLEMREAFDVLSDGTGFVKLERLAAVMSHLDVRPKAGEKHEDFLARLVDQADFDREPTRRYAANSPSVSHTHAHTHNHNHTRVGDGRVNYHDFRTMMKSKERGTHAAQQTAAQGPRRSEPDK